MIAEVARCGGAEAGRAIAAAHQALAGWGRRSAKERAGLLRRWYEAIMAARDDLAAALANAESDPTPLAAAAHATIAAIDDIAAALFSDAVSLGESHDDAALVPASEPTPVAYAAASGR